MRVLVCGGRNYADRDMVWLQLDRMHMTRGITMIIQGGARGADLLGEKWAVLNGIPCITFKPDWDSYGPAAGPIRNKNMLVKGNPDVVVAFPGGKGTNDMVSQARQANVRVIQIGRAA